MKKALLKIIACCAVAVMLMSLCSAFSIVGSANSVISYWNGIVPEINQAYEFGGAGTEEDPYIIDSAAELAQLASNCRDKTPGTAYMGKFFKLTVDIDLCNLPWWGIGGAQAGSAGFGDFDVVQNFFGGTFDGDGHVVYNLTLANHDVDGNVLHQQGLFGFVCGGTVKNIGIESGDINLTASSRVGALVGATRYGFIIENCYNKANVTVSDITIDTYIGGLLGCSMNPGKTFGTMTQKYIKDCYNLGTVTVTNPHSMYRIGHMVGSFAGATPEMYNCWTIGELTVTDPNAEHTGTNRRVGPLCGAIMDSPYFENCYAEVKVNLNLAAETIYMGGFCGYIHSGLLAINTSYYQPEGTSVSKAAGEPAILDSITVELEPKALPVTAEKPFLAEIGETVVTTTAEPIDITSDEPIDITTEGPNSTTTEEPNDTTTAGSKDTTTAGANNTTTEEPSGTSKSPTPAPSGTTKASEDEGGCGSVSGICFTAFMALVAVTAAVIIKKK